MTDFSRKVIALIQKIPRGKVATYGQIAKLAGNPYGSRGVAWILNSSSKKHRLPWQRVLSSKGKISLPQGSLAANAQKRKLEREGVRVGPNLSVDLKRYQWKKGLGEK
jgi:methylated-DNA-protein-cysteine methyltransferase-like protein